MKKFLILTSITNGKDKLLDPTTKFDNCDYIAFVDKKEDVKIWEQRSIFNFSSIDNYKHRRNAKPYKIISSVMFPDYEYIIWEDGNHQLKKDPQLILDEYGDSDFYLFKHPDRECLYEELQACLNWRLDDPVNLQNQYNFYRNVGYPNKNGLYELSTFIVKNTQDVKELQLMWFEQIIRFSSRDQISLPFCIWNKDIKDKIKLLRGFSNIFSMGGQNIGNEYFDDQGRHLKY